MEREIELKDDSEAIEVFGVQDRYLKTIRECFGVEVRARGLSIHIEGPDDAVAEAAQLFESVLEDVRGGGSSAERLIEEATNPVPEIKDQPGDSLEKVARTEGQRHYVRAMMKAAIVMALGPAGTGKTYLAVRMAVEALKSGRAKKLILCRPAVEAGENLGFLPGDFQAKVNPYLRPLYDALHTILDYDQVRRYTERDIIEIVPLAYMRGRTLNDAFIILDEGQNTTPSQMKMFLTRMGEASRIVVTADPSQADLPPGQPSGIPHARRVLGRIQGIKWVELSRADIVRHPLVAEIVGAYETYEKESQGGSHRDRKPRGGKSR